MKHKESRDLMVVLREANLNPDLLQAETDWLNAVLNRVELPRNVAACSEVIHISRYKIEKRFDRVLQCVQEKRLKPFVFLFNKN